MKFKILLSMIPFLILAACGTGADGDIYISGASGGTAVYWKNGIQTNLNADSLSSSGDGIYASGTDVYVSGVCTTASIPCYWKNGTMAILSNDSSRGSAYGVSVLNNNVYIGGSRSISVPYGMGYLSTPKAITWLNGVETILNGTASTTDSAFVKSLFVTSGGTVYAAGELQGAGGVYYGTYWKDGVPTTISTASVLNSIFVKDSSVYTAGVSENRAAYYAPGGAKTLLAIPANASVSSAGSIFVDGQDVYVAGNYYVLDKEYACYWKNGERTDLTDGMATHEFSEARAITVKNGNVYVAGFYIN
ncbi:MAG: hypothetical protein WCQ53_06385, partial [bacterium]